MLECLKNEASRTDTENGAVTHATTYSGCLDLFSTIGGLRSCSEQEIFNWFVRAFIENPDLALKTLFLRAMWVAVWREKGGFLAEAAQHNYHSTNKTVRLFSHPPTFYVFFYGTSHLDNWAFQRYHKDTKKE